MANMSYCRFHNTLQDLQDCKEVLDGNDEYGISSESEIRKARTLVELCQEIAEMAEDFDSIEDFIRSVEATDEEE